MLLLLLVAKTAGASMEPNSARSASNANALTFK